MSAAEGVRTLLRGTGQAFITLGLIVLLFAVYELYGTNLYTAREQTQLGQSLRTTWAGAPARPGHGGRQLPGIPLGSGFAVLWIPRLGIMGKEAKVVVEGVSHEDLKKGPGHYPGTALPGAVGNVVISGHRTTYGAPFNRLDELRPGDAIVIETRSTWFTYRMTGRQVVRPSSVEVTYAVPGQRTAQPTRKLLTLTTCNPKYSASQRLIVRGLLQSALVKTAGTPPALIGKS